MTVSDSGSPCSSIPWSNGAVMERKESRSISSSDEASDPALMVCLDSKAPLAKGPMNLVLKTRIAKASKNINDPDSQQTQTKSTTRTRSFTTYSSEFLPEEKVEEAVTVTDDGPVVQENLKKEEVYKKLSELAIIPADTVPKFVSTPERHKNRSTPATSTSSSPSHVILETPAVDILPERPELDREDSSESGSVMSDISGLTGVCTRISRPLDSEVPQEIYNDDEPLVTMTQDQEEEFKTQSLHQETTATTKRAPRLKDPARRVSFSTVCIREYERILGDNPSCSCGPSITIGWEFDEEEIIPVDEWESWRETEREPDRLVLCREEREDILLDLGYNHKVIAQAVRDIVKVKNKRRQTIHNLHASAVEEMVESAGRKVKSIRKVKNLFGKKKKKSDGDDEQSLYA